MANSWTPASAGSTPEPRHAGPGGAGTNFEERAFLVAGPGRAAEVAVVTLVEAHAIRISRDGLVSGVQGRPARTPLQAAVLRALPRPLGDVIRATANSPEAAALRQHLIAQDLVIPPTRRQAARRTRTLVLALAAATVFATIALDLAFTLAAIPVVGALVVSLALNRSTRPLTTAGRAAVRTLAPMAVSPNRIAMVAYYGLLGRVERHHVWEVLGISPAASATLKRRSGGRGSDGGASCGGGCGSCSSSSCGSSSSGGSDSGGSSCGGGGGGCGGGGGGD